MDVLILDKENTKKKGKLLLVKFPELEHELDEIKNKEYGINIINKTYGSAQKVWWICPKCESSYSLSINDKTSGINCPYCAGKRANHTNSLASLNPEVASQWHPTLNGDLTPHDFTCSSGKKAWWLGDCGHEWESVIGTRNKGCRCPYCTNQKTLKGFNDMWTTNPDLAKLLNNPEDGHKYMQSSNKKTDWKCPNCNSIIRNKWINGANCENIRCKNCGDSMSYPELVMYCLLKKLNIDFKIEQVFPWSNKKRYDFYIPSINTIIETHGMQHYSHGFERLGGRILAEEEANDKRKYEMAIENGIKEYIVIDCRHSEFEWIKNNIINSGLTNVLNINTETFNDLDLNEKSLVLKTWEIWNGGIHSINEISNKLSICRDTVVKYLKNGTTLGKCNYEPIITGSRKVVMLDGDGRITCTFKSIAEASRNSNNNIDTIRRRCHGVGVNESDEHVWMFLDDYNARNTHD